MKVLSRRPSKKPPVKATPSRHQGSEQASPALSCTLYLPKRPTNQLCLPSIASVRPTVGESPIVNASTVNHPAVKTAGWQTSSTQRIRCCYANQTAQFQIVRINNPTSAYLERAVVPYGKILFESGLHDSLEIHTGHSITAIVSDKIPCHQLVYAG